MGYGKPYDSNLRLAVDRKIGKSAEYCRDCKGIGQRRFSTDYPVCAFSEFSEEGKLVKGGCKTPLSSVKLAPLDLLILEIFTLVPWVGIPAVGAKRYKIKNSLDWAQARVLVEGYGIKFNQLIIQRLSICEGVILKQQKEEIDTE